MSKPITITTNEHLSFVPTHYISVEACLKTRLQRSAVTRSIV